MARIVCREGGGIVEGRPSNMLPTSSIASEINSSGSEAKKSHSSSIVVTESQNSLEGGSQTPISVQQ
jgi:hypothetical protein